MTPKELREELMRVWTEYRGIAEEARKHSRGLDDSERERRGVLETKITELEANIREADREVELGARIGAITERQIEVADRQGAKDPEQEYQRVFEKFIRSGPGLMRTDELQVLHGRMDEQATQMARDQGIATGAAGGFTVPQGFWAKITEAQKLFSGMLQVSNVLRTNSGNAIPWPTNDDTGNEGEILGENVATTVLDMTFGSKTLGAYMFTSRMIRTSLQLLQDSGVDIEGMIARKAGQRIGRRLNRALTVGTGTAEPQGVVVGLPAGQVLTLAVGNTGVTTGFWKSLIDLEHKVDAAYRQGGTCRFMLNDLTLAGVQKLEDGQGHPLWIPSVREGVPGLILGYPYTVNNHMAVPAANAKTIIFGDFNSGYVARQVNGGSMLRLSERYAEALQVAFLAFERNDGLVDDAGALAVLQHSAT